MTGTLDGKVVLLSVTGRSMGRVAQRVSAEGAIVAGGDIHAAAAAETLKLIQKDGFSPGTAGHSTRPARARRAPGWQTASTTPGPARFASLKDQPFAEIPAPRPVTGPQGKMRWTAADCRWDLP